MSHGRVVRVGAEGVLLAVGLAEDVVPSRLDDDDECGHRQRNVHVVFEYVSALQRVREWDPH